MCIERALGLRAQNVNGYCPKIDITTSYVCAIFVDGIVVTHLASRRLATRTEQVISIEPLFHVATLESGFARADHKLRFQSDAKIIAIR